MERPASILPSIAIDLRAELYARDAGGIPLLAHQALPQDAVELGGRHAIRIGEVEASRELRPVRGVVLRLDRLTVCNCGSETLRTCASSVFCSTVDACAVNVQLPEELVSNTSVMGRWNAVFRLMCCVPRTSSMVRRTLTWL